MAQSVAATSQVDLPQHGLVRSVALHLAPGLLVLLAFALFRPLALSQGFPPLMAFVMAILLVDIPWQLGVLYYEGRRRNGRLSLQGIVLYREPIPWWQFLLIFLGGLLAATLLLLVTAPVDAILRALFAWLPAWFFMGDMTQYQAYVARVFILSFLAFLVVTGVALPVVEELYFRGYLLPRLSRFRGGSPVLNAFLFALYHFWQPFGFASIFAQALILAVPVYWKRNVYLSISLHLFANLATRLTLLLALISFP